MSAPLCRATEDSLRPFSLRDSAEELEQLVQQQEPLLGNVCLKGQAAVWYAKPNAGDDWTVHRWKYELGERGKRGYVLVERPLTPEEQKALDDAF